MAGETVITIIGNLTGDPELRFTPNGVPVANFTIASTPRNFDRQSGEWKEGEPLFMRCQAWRDMAEHISSSLLKGMRVVAYGKLKTVTWETKEGERRSMMQLDVEEIGASLRFAHVTVHRGDRKPGGDNQGGYQPQQQGGGYQQNNAPQGSPAPQGSDPWGNQGGGNYGWGAPAEEEPPF